jgi:hypothetical protein
MFGTSARVVFLVGLSWATVCSAQSATPRPSASQAKDAVSSRLRHTTLLGRSEMQRPQPIPVVRPLRFQEIPVEAGNSVPNTTVGNNFQQPNPKDANPSTSSLFVATEETEGH